MEDNKKGAKALKLPEGVTSDMVDVWKEKWGKNLRIIDLPTNDDENEFFTVIAHIPTRRTLSDWEKFADSNPNKSKEILVKNSLLTGVEQVMADDALFGTCSVALMEIVPVRKAIIKNF